MLFTICIPTYNRANKIVNTLQSLCNQTFRDFEIVVIDDGSQDDTKKVVDSLEIDNLRYYYKENGGKHTALNMGIEKAKGELFLILDSDDSLLPKALETLSIIWQEISKKGNLCGIMGRCEANGQFIGKRFEAESTEMSYIDFHFGKYGGMYGDCCECIRLDVLKRYRWPESSLTHFVPEAYVMDRIGLEYSLYCTNEILERKEYLTDGITVNYKTHIQKNCVGYLYNIVSKLEEIFPYSKVKLKHKIITWWKYWNYVQLDEKGCGPRCKKVNILGWMVRFFRPLLNKLKGWT